LIITEHFAVLIVHSDLCVTVGLPILYSCEKILKKMHFDPVVYLEATQVIFVNESHRSNLR